MSDDASKCRAPIEAKYRPILAENEIKWLIGRCDFGRFIWDFVADGGVPPKL